MLKPLRCSRGYNRQRQLVRESITRNPELLNYKQNGLHWGTFIFLVAAGSSCSMLLYTLVQAERVRKDRLPRTVFLPLWLSADWPYKRQLPLSYIRYLDAETSDKMGAKYFEELKTRNVPGQVLDRLFRLPIAKDLLGFPLKSESNDLKLWIELKYPTIHGPVIKIRKDDSFRFLWDWSLKLIHWRSLDESLRGVKSMAWFETDAQAKIHEKESGRIHEVPCGRRKDYTIKLTGSLHVKSNEDVLAQVRYEGHIDFDHLGINRGVIIRNVELDLDTGTGRQVYKL